jgi:membrane associated rhomboid family serine protease
MPQSLTDGNDVPRMTRAVRWMIALNAAVFFVQVTLVGSSNMQAWLGSASEKMPGGWWNLVTYPFVHGSLLHLALSLATLWLFGPRLEQAWSAGEFTRYYLICGFGGWLCHVLFVRDGLLIGASAATLGVVLAYGARWADDEVSLFGAMPVRVKWVAALLVGAHLGVGLTLSGPAGGAGYLAHLGGLAAGWLLLRWSAAASLDRLRQRVSPLPDVPDEPPRAVPRSLPRSRERNRDIDEIVAQSNAALRRQTLPAPPGPARAALSAGDLNSVLDKISEQGIDSLTSVERRLLEELSRELRRKQ